MKSTCIISSKVFLKFTLIVLSIVICLSPAWAGKEKLTVMTRNLYIGAEIQSLAGAGSPEEFIAGIQAALEQIAYNNFPERAVALAAEIVKKKPHLVALQEVYDISLYGGYPFLPFSNYLDDLLNALDDQGASYYVAAVVNNLDLPIPETGLHVLDRDVILAREDVETQVVDFSPFCPGNPSEDGCNYQVVAEADTPIGIIAFERGFVAVDARVDDFEFRFFNTHLEVRNPDPNNPLSPLVQRYQALELVSFLGFPKSYDGPVIVAGDINSSPDDPHDNSLPIPPPPYMQLDGGLYDAWTLRPGKHKSRPGKRKDFTCCQDEDLLNKKSALYERIDVIFSSELPVKVKAKVVGNRKKDKTPSGLWPSDHAGVVARLYFEPFPKPKKHSKGK